MKKIIMVLLVLCMGIIIYFFIKEQLNGIVLSHTENTLLSITYLVAGISIFILYWKRRLENKNQSNSNT
ncbi:MAG: hypothetical protein ABI288_06685 [Ginsengibacter sp.]